MSACLEYLEYFKTQDHGNIDYQSENTPFIESRAEVLLSHGPITSRDPVDSVTIADEVDQFLGGDDVDEFSSEAAGLTRFCTSSTAQPTQSGHPATPPYVALLDDKSYVGTRTRSRPYSGPLTADDLFELLKRPRFRHRKRAHGNRTNTSIPSDPRPKPKDSRTQPGQTPDSDNLPASSPTFQLSQLSPKPDLDSDSKEPDADRRIIFITDLDSSTALALIRTVSGNHVHALRDALCNHLAAESIIASTITKGLIMFKLSFHLPFFVLRSSRMPRADSRTYSGGMSLRNTKDVSFLNWHDDESQALVQLHEAHVSCVVSGFHDWSWIAYCFVDTYYDGDDQDRECVKDYDDQAKLQQGMSPDAPTLGRLECDQPIWSPREYFVHVFYFRLLKARSEWYSVHEAFRDSFRRYTHNYDRSSLPRRPRDRAGEHEYRGKPPQENLDLLMQYLNVFSKLSECLTQTIDAYDTFRSDSMDSFMDIQQPVRGGASLAEIRSIIDGFKRLRKKFRSMQDEGCRIKDTLENVLNREASDNNKGQDQLVRNMMPIVATTGIFSMQKMNIPFVQDNFAWFLAILVIFSLMVFGGPIFTICYLRLLSSGKVVREHWSLWNNLSIRARRRYTFLWNDLRLRARRRNTSFGNGTGLRQQRGKKSMPTDLESGNQASIIGMNEGLSQSEGSSSGNKHCPRLCPSIGISSRMNTPPDPFIAGHQGINETALSGLHEI